MASRGLRDIGDGAEKVASPAEVEALKKRGRRVQLMTAGTALVATAGVLASVLVRG